jgi:hypothetical protein
MTDQHAAMLGGAEPEPEPDSIFGIDLDEPVEYWTEIRLEPEPEKEAETRMNEPNIYILTHDDPGGTVDGPGCSVRDLDAYEARMDAALDDPEPEIG